MKAQQKFSLSLRPRHALWPMALAAGAFIAAANAGSACHAALVVRATLNPRATTLPIGTSFTGISVEWNQVRPYLQKLHGDRAATAALLRRLARLNGPPVVRVGGNSEDQAAWNLPHRHHIPHFVHINITRRILTELGWLSRQTRSRLILGLNLGARRPAWAAKLMSQSEAIIRPSHILAFEIGNEPDLFGRFGKPWRGSGQPYYYRQVSAYLKVLAPMARGRKLFAGGAFCCGWRSSTPRYIKREAAYLAVSTLHEYPLGAPVRNRRSPQFASIANLLKNSSARAYYREISASVIAGRKAGVPVRWGEMNSAYGGGKDGVSNTFAAALWGTDAMFETARAGAGGVNFHMPGYYGAWLYGPRGHVRVMPLYYGMWLFAKAAGMHGRLVPVAYKRPLNIKIWAVRGSRGELRIVILNKDLTRRAIIHLRVAGYMLSHEMRMAAASVKSRWRVRLGPWTFNGSINGDPHPVAWNRRVQTIATVGPGAWNIPMPPASGALLVLSRRPPA